MSGLLRTAAGQIAADLAAGRGFLLLPFALGSGAALRLSALVEPKAEVALVLVAVIILVVGVLRAVLGRTPLLAVLFLLGAVGAASVDVATAVWAAPRFERERTIDLTGWVEAVEDRASRGQRLLVRVAAMEPVPKVGVPFRVRLTARGAAPIAPGTPIRVRARLSPPTPPLVPGGYDFARNAWFAGIGAVGFSLGAPVVWAEAPPPPPSLVAAAGLETVRATVSKRIRDVLGGDAGAIAAALVVGDRAAIDPETDEALRTAGLSHVLSISGLHMALVSATIFAATRLVFAAIPPIALRLPVKRWAAGVALAGALGYLLISGLSVPTQRSAVMVAVALIAVIVDRQPFSLRLVAVAALIVFVLTPAAVADPGAQMSFAAVTALIAAHEAWAARRKPPDDGGDVSLPVRLAGKAGVFLALSAATSLVAGLATGPIALYHFGRLAPLSVVANLLATPLIAFLIMPMGLAAALLMPLGLDGPPLLLMGWGIDRMVEIAEWTASITPASGGLGRPGPAAVIVAVAGGVWLCVWTRPVRLAGLPLIAAGLVLFPFGPRPDLIVDAAGRRALVRLQDGSIRVLGDADDFQTELWLATLGEARTARDPSLVTAVGCDPEACVLPADPRQPDGDARVSLVFRDPAFADECARSSLVITARVAPPWCRALTTVVDGTDLSRTGTASFTIDWTAVGNTGAALALTGRAIADPPAPWHRPGGLASTGPDPRASRGLTGGPGRRLTAPVSPMETTGAESSGGRTREGGPTGADQ